MEEYNEHHNPEVLTVRADALYYLGFFEHSLVNYYKAMRFISSKVWKANEVDRSVQ